MNKSIQSFTSMVSQLEGVSVVNQYDFVTQGHIPNGVFFFMSEGRLVDMDIGIRVFVVLGGKVNNIYTRLSVLEKKGITLQEFVDTAIKSLKDYHT